MRKRYSDLTKEEVRVYNRDRMRDRRRREKLGLPPRPRGRRLTAEEQGPILTAGNVISARPTSEMLLEARIRAEAADRRSLTQVCFGDPAPGYSALDRAQGV